MKSSNTECGDSFLMDFKNAYIVDIIDYCLDEANRLEELSESIGSYTDSVVLQKFADIYSQFAEWLNESKAYEEEQERKTGKPNE